MTRSRSWAPAGRRRMASRSPRPWAADSRPRACRWSPGSRSGSIRPPTKGAAGARHDDRGACRQRRRGLPRRGWRLHAAVAERGAVISEMPPGAEATAGASSPATASSPRSARRRWSCRRPSARARSPPRTSPPNRPCGRRGPGPVTSRLSAGTHGLIQAGAPLTATPETRSTCWRTTGRAYAIQPPHPSRSRRRWGTARRRRGRGAGRVHANARTGQVRAGRPG